MTQWSQQLIPIDLKRFRPLPRKPGETQSIDIRKQMRLENMRIQNEENRGFSQLQREQEENWVQSEIARKRRGITCAANLRQPLLRESQERCADQLVTWGGETAVPLEVVKMQKQENPELAAFCSVTGSQTV